MSDAPTEPISLGEATRVWLRIGLLSFGGPAGQIALMHRELVEKRRWLDEARFLHALNYCMLLPGPEAQQLAIYIGWLMHRTLGGVIAGVLFVLPGAVTIMVLSALYAELHAVPLAAGVLFGIKAAVFALVLEALQRIAKRALKSRLGWVCAVVAFVAIFAFAVPFPLIVVAAALFGLGAELLWPGSFPLPAAGHIAGQAPTVIDGMDRRGELGHTGSSLARALRVVFVCCALWSGPLFLAFLLGGPESVFFQTGILFSKAAVVTFGGAYAVLAYVAQSAVQTYGWLQPAEMVDGLGLAETTPGPLILVLQFVGFLAAYRSPLGMPPLLAGILGGLLTLWVTFVPCFLWIFLGAPYIEKLRGNRRLHAALSAITAAVVGVVLNLSLWFGLHVLFAVVHTFEAGPFSVLLPELGSLVPTALLLSIFAMMALLRWHWSVPRLLLVCAVAGAAISGIGQ